MNRAGDLRVAVVGLNDLSAYHLDRWRDIGGVTIAAVCDSDSGLAAAVAAQLGAQAFTDTGEMHAGSTPHIVDVCGYPRDRAHLVELGVAAGASVLFELPLPAPRGWQPAAGELLVSPLFSYRFDQGALFARELIQNDDLGRLTMFRSRFSGRESGVETTWRADRELAGGGVLSDIAVHSLDLFRWLVGEIDSVAGRVASYNPLLRVEDSAALVVESRDGAIGVIEASWSTPGGRNVLELYGTAGACLIDYDTGQVRYRTADMAVWETREMGGADRLAAALGHFAEAVRGLHPPTATVRDATRAGELITEVYHAAGMAPSP